MLLIPDNTTLRSFIPNSFSSVDGSPSLFDKIAPFLHSAEIWFKTEFIGEDMLARIISEAQAQDDPLYFLPRRIVAMRAWMTAIPAIDIVISANGVGVVETNSLKPASKAKIDNLLSSVAKELDRNIEQLLQLLPSVAGWTESQQAAKFRATLFPTFQIVRSLGYDEDLWSRWLSLTPRIRAIEDEIGEKWISAPVLEKIRIDNLRIIAGNPIGNKISLHKFGCPDCGVTEMSVSQTEGIAIEKLISKVKAAVSIILDSDDSPQQKAAANRYLEEANAIVRNNPAVFPEWEDSPTARFFSTPAFRNRPASTGYFF